MRGRYIKASELRSYAFCARAWMFEERGGAASALAEERAQGIREHLKHGGAAVGAQSASRLAGLLFVVGLAGIAAAIVWMIFQR